MYPLGRMDYGWGACSQHHRNRVRLSRGLDHFDFRSNLIGFLLSTERRECRHQIPSCELRARMIIAEEFAESAERPAEHINSLLVAIHRMKRITVVAQQRHRVLRSLPITVSDIVCQVCVDLARVLHEPRVHAGECEVCSSAQGQWMTLTKDPNAIGRSDLCWQEAAFGSARESASLGR